MKKHLLTIIGLALVATAANAQTITDALRRDQQGQGKVVINQSADIERLVNNRQQQNTTTPPQNVKTTDKQGNQQQNTKPVDKQGIQQQTGKTNPTQEKNNNNATQHFATGTSNNTQQHQQNGQRQNDQNANERQQGHNGTSVAERPNDHQTTERPTTNDRPATTERPTTSYNYDYEAPTVNTNKKIMRHSYKTTGYRIQVYTGGNKRNDRTKCEQIAARLKSAFPDQPIYVHFYSPSWKCRLGNFTSMSEASAYLKQIRKMGYNQACLVKGKISVQY